MIARIDGREKTKLDLQVHLGEAMLRLGGKVRLDEALLCLGRLDSRKFMPRVRLGESTFA